MDVLNDMSVHISEIKCASDLYFNGGMDAVSAIEEMGKHNKDMNELRNKLARYVHSLHILEE